MSDLPFRRPVVIVGGIAARDRDRVREFVLALNAPVYAEGPSGLREDRALSSIAITAGERMLGRGDFDGVIRIGSVPTLRFWRDLDESRRELPVISFGSFSGLSRGEVRRIDALPHVTPRESDQRFFALDRENAA